MPEVNATQADSPQTDRPKIVAVIDIGSNSARRAIAEVHADGRLETGRPNKGLGGPQRKVPLGFQLAPVARQRDPRPLRQRDGEDVADRYRLEDAFEVVVAVTAAAQDLKEEVDLGGSPYLR